MDPFFGGIFSQFFGQAERRISPAIGELQEWVSELLQEAVQKWGITMMSGMPCGCAPRCQRTAVGPCVICRKPTCLEHAFTSSDAYLACHACIHQASVGQGNTPPRRERSHAKDHAKSSSSHSSEPTDEDLRKKNLKTLKLKPGAEDDEIRAAFKKIAFENHPDRVPEKKREAATKRFLEAKAAYEWLIQHAEQKAA